MVRSRRIFTLICLLLLTVTTLSARDLFEVSLGVSGVYDVRDYPLIEGLGESSHWTLGVGLHTRVSLLETSFEALLPYSNGGDGEIVSLLTSAALSFPLITDTLYMNIGGGLTTEFSYSDDSPQTFINGVEADSITFEDAMNSSTLHLKFAIDFLLGKAKIGMYYIMNSATTLSHVTDAGGWLNLLRSSKKDKIGIGIQLALF